MLLKTIDSDYEHLIEFLLKNNLFKKSDTWILEKFKRIHNLTYTIALWKDLYNSRSNNQKQFISGLLGDLLESIPISLLGLKKSVCINLRSGLENILKHIYYIDHPIEYDWYIKDYEYLNYSELKEYVKKQPLLKELLKKTNIFNNISNNYSSLSMNIHGLNDILSNSTELLSEIKFDKSFFNYYIKTVEWLCVTSNMFLICLNIGDFKSFDFKQREFIFKTIGRTQTRLIRQII